MLCPPLLPSAENVGLCLLDDSEQSGGGGGRESRGPDRNRTIVA